VNAEAALGGANPDPQIAWSTASFLRRLQARLTAVECVADALAADIAHAHPRDRAIHGSVGRPLPLIWAAA
jgi:hypothetical protein